ncbi:MAG TPA: hypothetical protein VK390_06125 [Propionibacteriaceae bacterium]|nr:hypothetical protein [Propionibacteriaceae bacterium]
MVPTADLAAAASTSHGGWFHAALVGVACPMVLVDVTSTYPKMFSLLGLSRVYACERFISIQRTPEQLRVLLRDTASWLDRQVWRDWAMTFVVLRPNGEVLPASVDWDGDGSVSLTVAPLYLHGDVGCWSWLDLCTAVLDGADPEALDLVRVFTLLPVGTQPGLRPLRLPTGRMVDLSSEDLGQVLIEERARASVSGPLWLVNVLKSVSNALCYGLLARADVTISGSPVETVGHAPDGTPLTTITRFPERPGPHQFLPAAASVCAAARLIMALAQHAIGKRGGVVAAVHADSLAVPCSSRGGSTALPDGTPLQLLTEGQLRAALDELQPLDVRFKWEVLASDSPTVGLVVGVNRVVFAQPGGGGRWHVVRSSDTGLGGHLADPSDQPGTRQPDGRWSWAAQLEAALLPVEGSRNDPEAGLEVDLDRLPAWGHRPITRRYVANRYSQLCRLRQDSGDPTVGPFARYLRAGTHVPGGPIALGPWSDARRWHEAPWRLAGHPIGIDAITPVDSKVLSPDPVIVPLTAPGPGLRIGIPSVAAHLTLWANPADPSTTGPRRGLRRPQPVHSAPGLLQIVGKDGTALLAADNDITQQSAHDATLVYGIATAGGDQLRQRARDRGIRRLSRDTALPFETIRNWANGGDTSRSRLSRLITALEAPAKATPAKSCAMPECLRPARSRSPWCSEAHKKAAARQQARSRAADHGSQTCS